MTDAFSRRFPTLLHVTDAAALASIARHGLLSAEALCALFEVPDAEALLGRNRNRAVTLRHPVHGMATLRRQKLHEAGLAPRLGPGLTPACWRRFINARVFFWVSDRDARVLARAEPGRVQVTLRLATAALIEAGLALAAAPVNGGSVDRMPPGRGRRREPELYRPVAAIGPGERVREVALPGAVPPALIAHALAPHALIAGARAAHPPHAEALP